MNHRAYSTLVIKKFDDDKRIIEGIASTPNTDRVGDIVEPHGAEFDLPLPFLMDHGKNGSDDSIGHVIDAKVTDEGIYIKAQIEQDPALPYLDAAWAKIKKKLVRGLSIGFKGLGTPETLKTGGVRFKRWEWLELSAVVIPANMDASISVIKSIDRVHRSEGKTSGVVYVSTSPGVSGKSKSGSSLNSSGESNMATVADQVKSMEATRQAKAARAVAIMEASANDGRTLDPAEKEEYDNISSELKSIDEHLVRLREHEKLVASTITPLEPAAGTDPALAKGFTENAGRALTPTNGGGNAVLFQRSNLPKGTAFTRYAMAVAAAKGNEYTMMRIIDSHFKDTPEVMLTAKAAVAAATTQNADWAAPLVYANNMASEFIELLRPQTFLGRIAGLRRVPFNVRMGKVASGTSSGWVGEGAPKPLTSMDFDTVTLTWAKIASIVVMTQELMRFSNPDAEGVVRQDMIDAMAQFRDQQFIDPTVAAVSNVSPASVTNGVTPRNSTGITFAQVQADVQAVLGAFITANHFPRAGVWVMHPRSALALSQVMMTGGDQYAFPGLTMNGGTFFGFPVITSANVPILTGNQTIIVLMDAAEIFYSEDPGVRLDASDQATVQMDSAPDATTTASTVLVSLWQRNLVGLRAEQFVNWSKRRASAVQFIDGVNY